MSYKLSLWIKIYVLPENNTFLVYQINASVHHLKKLKKNYWHELMLWTSYVNHVCNVIVLLMKFIMQMTNTLMAKILYSLLLSMYTKIEVHNCLELIGCALVNSVYDLSTYAYIEACKS